MVFRGWQGAVHRGSGLVFGILLGLGLVTGAVGPAAGAEPAPGGLDLQERQASAEGILNFDSPSLVARMRKGCAAGARPAAIARDRAEGSSSLPDAADFCAMALLRHARDGTLLALYRDVAPSDYAPASVAAMPAAIGAQTGKPGGSQLALGNGTALTVTPALAWDAGFTVAYQRGERRSSGLPEAAALKPAAERCLAQKEPDMGLCYATGYAYGMLAVNGRSVTAVGASR